MKKFLYFLRDIIVLAAILMVINLITFVVFGIAPINVIGSVVLSVLIRGIAALTKKNKKVKGV